jgi:hypothetical protein
MQLIFSSLTLYLVTLLKIFINFNGLFVDYLLIFAVFEIELRASFMLGKHPGTELYLKPCLWVIWGTVSTKNNNSYVSSFPTHTFNSFNCFVAK